MFLAYSHLFNSVLVRELVTLEDPLLNTLGYQLLLLATSQVSG